MDMKYVGVFLIVLFLIYFVGHMGTMQKKVVEGLSSRDDDDDDKDSKNGGDSNCGYNSDKIATNVEDMATKIKDGLLIDTYRENYENILMNLEEWANATILKTLVCGKINTKNDVSSNNSDAKKTIAAMALVKDLNEFKGILDGSMKYLDQK
tara:strand:+ start:54 stop:509 length:456 start_codon:yes stop_codon:yes gene_type:complete